MTPGNGADMELALQIVEKYRDLPGLRMALIAGSVARGIADQSSDLDLYLYWERADRDVLCRVNRLEPLGSGRLVGMLTPTGGF